MITKLNFKFNLVRLCESKKWITLFGNVVVFSRDINMRSTVTKSSKSDRRILRQHLQPGVPLCKRNANLSLNPRGMRQSTSNTKRLRRFKRPGNSPADRGLSPWSVTDVRELIIGDSTERQERVRQRPITGHIQLQVHHMKSVSKHSTLSIIVS